MALNQPHFRIRTDDTIALNTDSGWAAALDTNATLDAETIFRIRFEVDGSSTATTFKLQYRRNGGTWTDVPVNAVVPATSVDETEIVLSAQYVNDAATTDLLVGSSLTFEAGVGLEDNLTPSITLTSEHTEYEWALRIRTSWNNGTTKGRNADGDTFEYRIVESNGTVFTGTYTIPTVTLNIPDYLIGGTAIETPKRNGPFKDGNGNLYYYIEYGEPNVSDEPAMLKSTDGGKQWAIMDAANAPTAAQGADDNECADIQQVGSVLHIAVVHNIRSKYHTFRMSDNANPDTWGVVSETIHTPTTIQDQDISLGVRSDGSVVCIYQTDTDTIGYRTRSTGGTWSAESILDTTTGVYFSSGIIVIGANDLAYIFYKDHTNSLLYYKTLTSGGTLSGRTQYNASGTIPQIKAIPTAYYFDDDGTEVIVAFYRRGAGTFERRIIGGTLQAERQIANAAPAINQNASGAPEAAIAVRGVDIHSAWIQGADTSLVIYDVSLDGAAYGTDITKYDDAIAGLSLQGANVYRHSAANGGALVMAVVVDEADGFTGGNRYIEWVVSETAVTVLPPPPLIGRYAVERSYSW